MQWPACKILLSGWQHERRQIDFWTMSFKLTHTNNQSYKIFMLKMTINLQITIPMTFYSFYKMKSINLHAFIQLKSAHRWKVVFKIKCSHWRWFENLNSHISHSKKNSINYLYKLFKKHQEKFSKQEGGEFTWLFFVLFTMILFSRSFRSGLSDQKIRNNSINFDNLRRPLNIDVKVDRTVQIQT